MPSLTKGLKKQWHQQKKKYLTSKIRAIGEFHCKCSLGDDAADSMLDKIHFLANSALPDDVILWLEYLKT